MTDSILERTRTGGDILLGALLVLGGLVVLGHATLATAVSILFLGWMLLIFGVVGLVGALFRIGKGGFWASALTGGLLSVLGLVMLRNVGAAAVTLTLVAGALFLAGGITRLVVAAEQHELRGVLIFSGVVSTLLGLLVLFNLFTASFTLLGVLMGVEMLSDGVAMMVMGRVRMVPGAMTGTPRGAHA